MLFYIGTPLIECDDAPARVKKKSTMNCFCSNPIVECYLKRDRDPQTKHLTKSIFQSCVLLYELSTLQLEIH